MATYEYNAALIIRDASGNQLLQYPITRLENIIIGASDNKLSITGTDGIVIMDSEDSDQAKRITWTTLKEVLDKLYSAIGHTHSASDVGAFSTDAIIPVANGGTGNSTGNAVSATKLETARTIRTNLASTTAVSFDGTGNVTPGVTGILPATYGGTGNNSGKAASATILETARSIQTDLTSTAAVSFNGSADITPGVSGILPVTSGGTGNANGKATALASAVTIDGMSFDGSAAIVHYGTCDTAAATAAKVVSIDGFSLVTGARIAVRFTYANTASSPTLNVNGTGAKAIIQGPNSYIAASSVWVANGVVELVYNGTQWSMTNVYRCYIANRLESSRTIQTNLASTSSASFNGSANITPGVTGTLPLTNGGTGATTAAAARTSLGIENEDETLTVTLTNSASYPFNTTVDSPVSVSLTTTRSNLYYTIHPIVTSFSGGCAGDIEISSKALNGFKVSFNGSATSVTLTIYVSGGMY